MNSAVRLLESAINLLPEGVVNSALETIGSIPPARQFLSQMVINRYASAAAPRPRPFSLAVDGYTSWVTLNDTSFTGRHLPPCSEDYQAALPSEDSVVDLMMRQPGKEELAQDTSLLFPFFAQWFTDSFLRTDPNDFRKNQSNHGIDLCQIYGISKSQTDLLRSKQGGRLKSQQIEGEEFGVFLFEEGEDGTAILLKDFTELYSEANFSRVFGRLSDEQRLSCFAVGLEHGNSTLGNALMNTVFLRQHNRIAKNIQRVNQDWDDDRIFETARNVNIVLLLKIVVQDYVRHIAGFDLPLKLTLGEAEMENWYRTNWITVEFNLLYRWHGLIPNQFKYDSTRYDSTRMLNANDLLFESGVDQLIRDASKQKSGRIGLGQAPEFLRQVKANTVTLARNAKLMPYNDYREHFGLDRLRSFEQLSSDPTLISRLRNLYGSINRVEYLVGLLAEEYEEKEMMGKLQLTMVAHDAFTHVLTNPLLAKSIFNKQTFSPEGMREIESIDNLADLVLRNTKIKNLKEVSFKFSG